MYHQQAGAIPYRKSDRGLEFLLVTSKKGNWIFPKGFVEPGEAPEDAARKEVREEAGIDGEIMGAEIGSYEDKKRGDMCRVVVFLLAYRDEVVPWEEAYKRQRRWCTYNEAIRFISHKQLPLLERAYGLLHAS